MVDLLSMKALMFQGDKGEVKAEAIPDDLQGQADDYREKLIEAVAETDDDLLTRYLEGEELSADDITQGLSAGVAASQIFPVLCLSGGQTLGIQPVLDAIVDLLPSPASRPSVIATNPKTHEEVERSPDPTAPFTPPGCLRRLTHRRANWRSFMCFLERWRVTRSCIMRPVMPKSVSASCFI